MYNSKSTLKELLFLVALQLLKTIMGK